MKSVIGMVGATLLLAGSAAWAQDSSADAAPADESGSRAPAGFVTIDYLGIIGTYTLADDARNVGPADIDHGSGFSAIYGHLLDEHWGYEVHAFNETYETGDSSRTDFYRYGLGADATYAFGNRTKLTPFLLAGGGINYNDVWPNAAPTSSEDDSYDWFLNAGGGFVTGPVTQIGYLRVRGEARYIYDSFSESGDIRLGLGVEIPLLRDAKLTPMVNESVQIIEVATGLHDSDGDGVVDEKDQCPETPSGTRVNGEGCPLEKIISLKGVTFEFNRARLRPDAVTILDGAATILQRYPDMKVEVAGHTDNVGNDDYNQKLSEKRASAVRTYFADHGIPADQMSVKGYGESEPVADNETEEGRELNRRVELRILN